MISYAATKVKKLVTGSGRAAQGADAARDRPRTGLPKLPEPHDVADALAIALCHYFASERHHAGGSRSATFTGVNKRALWRDPDDRRRHPERIGMITKMTGVLTRVLDETRPGSRSGRSSTRCWCPEAVRRQIQLARRARR